MAIEMDKFVVNRKSIIGSLLFHRLLIIILVLVRVGQNKVVRMSSESSVIIPFSSTFPDIVVDTSGAIVKVKFSIV